MKLPIIEKIEKYAKKLNASSVTHQQIHGQTLLRMLAEEKVDYLGPEELKLKARAVIDASDLTVSAFAEKLSVSRQRVYQVLKYDEEKPTEGLDLVTEILKLGGLKVSGDPVQAVEKV